MAKDMMPGGDLWGDMGEARKKIFEIFSLAPFQTGRLAKEMGMGQWYPAVDVEETKTEVLVTAELPGMSENDIQLEVSADSVEISGERQEMKDLEDKEAGYIHKERSFGKFFRSIPLPSEIDPDRAEATFKNGVLKIKLPRISTEEKGKRLTIKKGES